MKRPVLSLLVVAALVFSGCRTPGVEYSKNLFQHLPDDPQLIALVNPNDVTSLVELALREINFQEFFGDKVKIDAEELDYYRQIAIEMLEALGIPVDRVEAAGVLVYYDKPVFLLSGAFERASVTAKLEEIGYQADDEGFFDYVYHTQKLVIPADGVMMMAERDLLEDLISIPEDHRMWDREDFADYRLTSPLDNSVFLWAEAPRDFLDGFAHRDDLGAVSLAMKFSRTITIQGVVRIKDPQKTVYLHDIVAGTVKIGQGLFGGDPDYGPLFKGITVTQNNRAVTASLVVPAERVVSLKDRIKKDFLSEDTSTFDKLNQFLERF